MLINTKKLQQLTDKISNIPGVSWPIINIYNRQRGGIDNMSISTNKTWLMISPNGIVQDERMPMPKYNEENNITDMEISPDALPGGPEIETDIKKYSQIAIIAFINGDEYIQTVSQQLKKYGSSSSNVVVMDAEDEDGNEYSVPVLFDNIEGFITKMDSTRVKTRKALKKLVTIKYFKQIGLQSAKPTSLSHAKRAGERAKDFRGYKDIRDCITDTELSDQEVETAIKKGYLPEDYSGGDVNWLGDQIYHYAFGMGVIDKVDKRFSRVTICEKIVGIATRRTTTKSRGTRRTTKAPTKKTATKPRRTTKSPTKKTKLPKFSPLE